jgi:hypothetical protein
MTRDRYLKGVLTIIALELLWLAANGLPARASAQTTAATPVVITGIRIAAGDGLLPVSVRGTVAVSSSKPLKVEADRPLPVEEVPYTPKAKPGE